MRWITWFVKRETPPGEFCRHCPQILVECEHCRGDWQGCACTRCAVGRVCPTHRLRWY